MGRKRTYLIFRLLFWSLVAGSAACSATSQKGAQVPPDLSGSSEPGKVIVRVSFQDLPAEGVRVLWLSRPGEPGEPAAAGTTGKEGAAPFSLPSGKLFLVAGWRPGGGFALPPVPGDRFAWFGGNPVYAGPSAPREIFLTLEEFPPPPETLDLEAGGTGVAGRVTGGGAPLPDVFVSAYLRPDTGFKDLGFAASVPTAEDGSFLLELPPGRYWIVAKRRASGGVAGPLRKGDWFGVHPGNPVEVREREMTRIAIPATQIRLRNAPSYSGDYRASAYVEGRILGADGRPRAGVHAALYDNPDLLNRPVFLSDATGPDGAYRLPVPVPGTYYLGARTGYGGQPAPGDLYGRYEGNPAHTVTVGDGDRLTGIDIVVHEVW